MTEQISLWEPPPRQEPAREPPPVRSSSPRLPWYRRAWFVSLVIVTVFATAGAVLGSRLP
jgi:hypothetical protein